MSTNNRTTLTSEGLASEARRHIHRESLMSTEMAILIALAIVSVPVSLRFLPEYFWAVPSALLIGSCAQYWSARFDPALRERVLKDLMPSWRQPSQLLEELEQANFERGAQQLITLEQKFDNLLAILDRRYSRDEFTYMRSVGAGQEVYLLVCDGLRHGADHLLSVSTIQSQALTKQIEAARADPARQSELEALERRLELLDDTNWRIAQLLGENEVLLTALDEATTTLASANSGSRLSRTDADTAVAELERLIRRTHAPGQAGRRKAKGARRLSAMLAADVEGYTRLVEQDTEGTVLAWKAARDEVIQPTVREHAGRLVKLTGDGFLVEFSSVQDAVNCALLMQQGLSANVLRFRIGIHLGDVVDDGEDIHGEGVNIAARIESLSPPGGLAITASVYEQVRHRVDTAFEDLGNHAVKHVTETVRVYCAAPTAGVRGPEGSDTVPGASDPRSPTTQAPAKRQSRSETVVPVFAAAS